MTQECWLRQMNRLRSMYGEKAFPEERVRLIARELTLLSDDQLALVVDDVIANLNHSPTLKDFLKYAENALRSASSAKERAFEQNISERRKAGKACWYCDDVGTISAVDKTNPNTTTFSFGCPDASCVAREFKAKNMVCWSTSFEKRFQPCFMGTGKTTFQIWQDVHQEQRAQELSSDHTDEFSNISDVKNILSDLKKSKNTDNNLPPAG